jgi:hypothetical protein
VNRPGGGGTTTPAGPPCSIHLMPVATLRNARRAALVALLAAAAVPATAPAKIIELGETSEVPKPSCPAKPCLAVSRTTGYQVKVGDTKDMFIVPRKGRIVAWTALTGDPSTKQIKFFNSTLGGAPSAGITVFKPGDHLYGTILAKSPIEDLTDYMGRRVQFPLEHAIEVKKGQRVALTVPTWAPMLAVGFGKDTSWRASRDKDQCDDTSTQTAQTTIGATTRFLCLYQTARLTYTVTFITEPKPFKEKKKS